MSESYEEHVMKMMSNNQQPITVTKEMDAQVRFPVPKTDPNLVAVRYSDGRSVWERDSREDVKALLERVAELEERVQALEGKE